MSPQNLWQVKYFKTMLNKRPNISIQLFSKNCAQNQEKLWPRIARFNCKRIILSSNLEQLQKSQ